VYEEARRLLPHAVHDGHVVGPHSGIAVDAVEVPDQLLAHRQRLVERKRYLREERDRLEQRRGSIWAVAAQKRWYPPRNLEALEIRADAALVDQNLYAFRFQTEQGGSIGDGYRVSTLHRRDQRLWSAIIHGERQIMRRILRPQERFARHVLGPQRAVLDTWRRARRALSRRHPVVGMMATVLMAAPVAVFWILFKIQEAVLTGVVKAQRTLMDKTVDLPVMVKEGAMDTREEFATQSGRRGLLRATLNEEYLTPERRRVILFLSAVMLVLAWAFAEILITLTYPEALAAKRSTDLIFGYAIATRVALPLPFEPILIGHYPVLGLVPTIAVAAVGAVVGSWILFLVGTEANKGIKRLFEDNVMLDRALGWMERNARKYGYVVLGVILAIPFSPDTVPLVVFSMLNLRMRWFLLTVFVATLVRTTFFLSICCF
jgi:membrane protein DedA with SNARE-associated domain